MGQATSSLPSGGQEEPHRGFFSPPQPLPSLFHPQSDFSCSKRATKRFGQTRRSLLLRIYLPKLGFPKAQMGKAGNGHSLCCAGREWHRVRPATHLWHPALLWALGPPPQPGRMLAPGGLSTARPPLQHELSAVAKIGSHRLLPSPKALVQHVLPQQALPKLPLKNPNAACPTAPTPSHASLLSW